MVYITHQVFLVEQMFSIELINFQNFLYDIFFVSFINKLLYKFSGVTVKC